MIASLYDSSPPLAMQLTEKTTIKNGNIIREKIWRDQWGHEYDRVDLKFNRKLTASPSKGKPIPPTPEELFWIETYLACMTIFLFLGSMFLWGFVVGRYSMQKRKNHGLLPDELSG